MSLIQEALKRKAEEEAQGSEDLPPAASGTEPAEPPPPTLPPRPPPGAPTTHGNPWRVLLGIAVGIVVLLGIAALLLFHAHRHWSDRSTEPLITAEAVYTPEETEPTATDMAPETSAAPELAADVAPPEPESIPPHLGAPEEPLPATPAEDPIPAETASPPDEPAATVPTVEPAPEEPLSSPPPETTPVVWPSLILEGVVYAGRPDAGSVYINRRIVSVGDSIDGVEVRTVAPRGAELGYRGETRFLHVGKSIP